MFRIGELIKVCRVSAGLTQTQLAWEAKTTQSYLSSIEKGHTIPKVDTVERLLDACGYELGVRQKL